ncbi:MAG: transglycosylase domain-containing protein [Oscillospiraceae bacterium]|nr:transglycosylase domain-containing protein [Oscillospiraceae bacterium]
MANPKKRSSKQVPVSDGQIIVRRLFELFGKAFIAMVLVGIISGSIVAAVMAVYVFKSLDGTVDIDLHDLDMKYTTILYGTDKSTGEEYELKRLQSSENRIWVDFEDMPDHLWQATIAAEDKRFMEHQGVDWKRTTAAFINQYIVKILPGTQGGSTITQQVIKNVTGEKEISAARKINEIFSALKLEKQFSKEEILESYLNTIPFGGTTHGVQAAANRYFDKDVSELTVPEAACIITITNAPSYYNPFGEKGAIHNKERRNYIYTQMLDLGYITQEEYEEYYDSDVEVARKNTLEGETAMLTWFEDYVIDEVISDLKSELNITGAQAWDMVYNKGLRIYTTYDPLVQKNLDNSYKNSNTFPPVINSEYPESAVVVLNAEDGSIAGLIGGNEKNGDRLFNRATAAQRHPGSTMKPISPYLQAFEMDMITWSTMFMNDPIMVDGEPWPVNFYSADDGKKISVVYALQRSINRVPAQLMEVIGPEQAFNFLDKKLAFHSLVSPEDNYQHNDMNLSPMTLGGMTVGVTPLEMAGAYRIFATGGKFVKPYSYTLVTDADDNVLLEKDTKSVRVISEETATIINKLLQAAAMQAPGTGTAANLGFMPTAGKTGTSSDDYDQWFIGMTPYYVTAVWMGYDEPSQILYYNYPPPILWKNLMTPIHQNLEPKEFAECEEVEAMEYCVVSGDLATYNCPETATGWYKESFAPSNCTVHMRGGSSMRDYDDNDGEFEGGVRTRRSSSNDD